MRKSKPKPPKTLSIEGKKLCQRIFDESDMDSPAISLLNLLVQSFDRMNEAREHIAKHGIVLAEKTANGDTKYRANPACGIERDSKAAMMRAWKLLGYDQAPAGVL